MFFCLFGTYFSISSFCLTLCWFLCIEQPPLPEIKVWPHLDEPYLLTLPQLLVVSQTFKYGQRLSVSRGRISIKADWKPDPQAAALKVCKYILATGKQVKVPTGHQNQAS